MMEEDGGALDDKIIDAQAVAFTLFTRFEDGQWRGEAWVGLTLVWFDDFGPIADMGAEEAMAATVERFGQTVAALLGWSARDAEG